MIKEKDTDAVCLAENKNSENSQNERRQYRRFNADCVKEAKGDIVPLYVAGMQFVDVLRGDVKEIMLLLATDLEETTPGAFNEMLQGHSYNEIIVNR